MPISQDLLEILCCPETKEDVNLITDEEVNRINQAIEEGKVKRRSGEAEKEKINGEIFNVGSNSENYTVKEIASSVKSLVKNSKIEYAENVSKDKRSYKVDFSKIHSKLGYATKWSVKDGIKELCNVFKQHNFTKNEFEHKKFSRLRYLNWLREENLLDENLRFKKVN